MAQNKKALHDDLSLKNKRAQMSMYLLAFMINVSNLNPIITKDCIKMSPQDANVEALKVIKGYEKMNLKCERNPEVLSYNCVNKERGLIGKVVIIKDLTECKSFPNKLSNDLRNLLGR